MRSQNERKAQGQKQPFTPEDVSAIRSKLSTRAGLIALRDLTLFEVAISSMLRTSDITNLRVCDVLDSHGAITDTLSILQKKTKRIVRVPLSRAAREALGRLIAGLTLSSEAFLFAGMSNANDGRKPLSAVAFRLVVKSWADLAGHTDTGRFSGHSTRRTRASVIYRETRDIEAVRRMLGHANLQYTQRYLGLSDEDALATARRFEL